MGVSSSVENPSPIFLTIESWPWSRVVSIVRAYTDEEFDFGIDKSVISAITGLSQEDGATLIRALTSFENATMVNAVTLLSAILCIGDASQLMLDSRVAMVFDLFDFDGSAQISMDETTILLMCVASALSCALNMQDTYPPDAAFVALTQSIFADQEKSTSRHILKQEFISWANKIFFDVPKHDMETIYRKVFLQDPSIVGIGAEMNGVLSISPHGEHTPAQVDSVPSSFDAPRTLSTQSECPDEPVQNKPFSCIPQTATEDYEDSFEDADESTPKDVDVTEIASKSAVEPTPEPEQGPVPELVPETEPKPEPVVEPIDSAADDTYEDSFEELDVSTHDTEGHDTEGLIKSSTEHGNNTGVNSTDVSQGVVVEKDVNGVVDPKSDHETVTETTSHEPVPEPEYEASFEAIESLSTKVRLPKEGEVNGILSQEQDYDESLETKPGELVEPDARNEPAEELKSAEKNETAADDLCDDSEVVGVFEVQQLNIHNIRDTDGNYDEKCKPYATLIVGDGSKWKYTTDAKEHGGAYAMWEINFDKDICTRDLKDGMLTLTLRSKSSTEDTILGRCQVDMEGVLNSINQWVTLSGAVLNKDTNVGRYMIRMRYRTVSEPLVPAFEVKDLLLSKLMYSESAQDGKADIYATLSIGDGSVWQHTTDVVENSSSDISWPSLNISSFFKLEDLKSSSLLLRVLSKIDSEDKLVGQTEVDLGYLVDSLDIPAVVEGELRSDSDSNDNHESCGHYAMKLCMHTK
mmetsp:Transcript_4170/g.6446  ORF Transcript_4170/g.6446 Transcript_4170/m.6446 type:complete len:751 (+) Transcript_4170:75-2327(+)